MPSSTFESLWDVVNQLVTAPLRRKTIRIRFKKEEIRFDAHTRTRFFFDFFKEKLLERGESLLR
ncbi:hypothetical protein GCM10022408_37740 [Hymenobacter fastidiosus]|uniref:Uncharacterized protein n=1 Tax=Hymenobacter fastidiosus TaxID=486264 RepID=A0ABP7T2T1_9BACT